MLQCKFALEIKGQSHGPYLKACALQSNMICPHCISYIDSTELCELYQPEEMKN